MLKGLGKITVLVTLSCYLILCCLPQCALAQKKDTIPAQGKRWFSKLNTYVDSLKSRRYRDSVLSRISRHNDPPPSTDDSSMTRSEQGFLPYSGKAIRRIHYRKVATFGPRNINDTTFSTSMRLIHIANRLHFDSQEWVIRQNLFFREKDTINAYELADNERYLRNRPFIQDARIHAIQTVWPDSVDILVVTKDVFEYGVDLRKLTPTSVAAKVSNNNLFGAGQGAQVGFRWDKDYSRPWGTEAQYTKYNLLGSFMDVTIGYSELNPGMPLDTGVYEGSYYLRLERPLYRTSAKIAGGLTLAKNYSVNIWSYPDTVYRDYMYKLFDGWIGYNFRNRFGNDGHFDNKFNMALLFRYSNIAFDKRPDQEMYKDDPIYNNRHYYLGQFKLFKQDFFKAHHFFGFGRTEDIPYGYNASLSMGWENWVGRKRFYTGLEGQKFWHTRRNGLLSLAAGISSFWQAGVSEDMVIHANASYYSRLMSVGRKSAIRQFVTLDYLGNPNNYFYRPLNINMEQGIWGFKRSVINGFHRLVARSETVYYSPWKIYGFKFNFFGSIEAAQLSHEKSYLVENPVYTGFGLGVRIRNENLSLNTLKAGVYYYPKTPDRVPGLYFELTTVTDLRFDIYGLKAPSFLSFW
ncbi:hypothetical protein [Chitinophaga sp. YIM B06452]|uniref:hypothetical protein n=1 Tax=Chitinophaga sp. YIM B06452 TaxID=3082158 RepID=UPI0031FE7D18